MGCLVRLTLPMYALQNVADVRERLRAEGYDQRQLEGRARGKQIMASIKNARNDA
jgi:hypothetical protein